MLPIEDNVPLPGGNAAANTSLPQNNDPLSLPGARKELARRILSDIDTYCQTAYDDGHRGHLGASLIGHECSRYLWNSFRWLKHEAFSGRMLRLFNRGHREEARFIEWLRGIGFQVVEHQADGESQYRIKGVYGHFGGSLDGQGMPPERYNIPHGMLLEFKTKGTGRGFTELKEKGIKLTNPQHYAQMSMYGKTYGYKYAVYMSICKNDDDLHVEVVELDWTLGGELERKATDVIMSQVPPEKIAMTPTYKTCKMCNFADICFSNGPVERNCRSCIAAQPVDGGEWYCNVYQGVIPKDYIKQGCERHAPITG